MKIKYVEQGLSLLVASCTNGLIRLVDGNDEFEGRLEMCVSGQWGTVCDEGFGQIDAEKACAQLKLPIDGECLLILQWNLSQDKNLMRQAPLKLIIIDSFFSYVNSRCDNI